MIVIRNWAVIFSRGDDEPPENQRYRIIGELYGDKNTKNGSAITTSNIISVDASNGYKTVKTDTGTYAIYSKDVASEYERVYPGAYRRLSSEFSDISKKKEE